MPLKTFFLLLLQVYLPICLSVHLFFFSAFVYFYTFHGLKKLAGAQGKQSAFKDLLFASVAGVSVYLFVCIYVCLYFCLSVIMLFFFSVFVYVYTFHGLKKLAGAQGKQSAFKDLLFASVAGVSVYLFVCIYVCLSFCLSVIMLFFFSVFVYFYTFHSLKKWAGSQEKQSAFKDLLFASVAGVSVYLFVCLSVFLSSCLSVFWPSCLSVHLFCLSLYTFTQFLQSEEVGGSSRKTECLQRPPFCICYRCVCLSVCLYLCLSVFLSSCLYVLLFFLSVNFYTFHGMKKLAGAQGKQSAFKDLLFASVAGVSVYLFVCMSVYLSFCLSVFLSICLCVFMSF